ncbi:MAG: hypothetical protein HY597_06670 [Candidatus Omnitrophica bacterium]|nr:hypothetical protein [Candidatus Omnitrophota bacterium]
MYEGWQFERWETPVSAAGSLALVSLIDDGNLRIVLQDHHNPKRRRFQLTFSKFPAYRNILEEYRTELWTKLSTQQLGQTLTIPHSLWITSLRKAEPLLDVHYPRLTHYMICTEDDVIEVLSPGPPEVLEIEPGQEGESVGKSVVYYKRPS